MQSQDFLLDEDRRDCVYLRIDLDVIDCYSWWENEQTKQEADDDTIKEPAMHIKKKNEKKAILSLNES